MLALAFGAATAACEFIKANAISITTRNVTFFIFLIFNWFMRQRYLPIPKQF
jgi:hypothetical protein